jgi:nitrous oxidase accessory protein NosD
MSEFFEDELFTEQKVTDNETDFVMFYGRKLKVGDNMYMSDSDTGCFVSAIADGYIFVKNDKYQNHSTQFNTQGVSGWATERWLWNSKEEYENSFKK